jgi:hypothetical protein
MALERSDVFTVRMAPEELDMLRELAQDDGVTASDFVRIFIRQTYAERNVPGKSKKPKREKRWLGGL